MIEVEMPGAVGKLAMNALHKSQKIFFKASEKWWPGLVLLAACITLFFALYGLTEFAFPERLKELGLYEAAPKITSAVLSFPIIAGISSLVFKLRSKHQADRYYIVVKTARLGNWIWVAGTTISCMFGFVFLLSGLSPLSGGSAVFSLAFLTIGISLADRPTAEMKLRSLFLLKRIANWQLLAASAAIALLYETPASNVSMFEQLGENRALLLAIMILWVAGAGSMTILLEPLKYTIEEDSTSQP